MSRFHDRQRLKPIGFLTIFLPAILACSFLTGSQSGQNSGQIKRISQLPTLTPTVAVESSLASTAPGELPIPPPSPAENNAPQPVTSVQVSSPDASEPLPATSPSSPETTSLSNTSLTQTAPQPNQTPVSVPVQITDSSTLVNSSDDDIPVEPVKAAIIIPTATPAKGPDGWAFVNIATYPDEFEDGVILYGDVVNETGSAQEVSYITGTFYDDQGQAIADANSAIDYWPIDVVPAGARLPFEISLPGIESTARFDLTLEAKPHPQPAQQNFEVLNLNQQETDLGYCFSGQVRNQGDAVQEYLVIMAVLYDSQDQMINFGEYYAADPATVTGDQTADFDFCIEPVSRRAARHELRVWGE